MTGPDHSGRGTDAGPGGAEAGAEPDAGQGGAEAGAEPGAGQGGSEAASPGGERQVPFFCPYCGEEELRPAGAKPGRWDCRACARGFELKFTGVLS